MIIPLLMQLAVATIASDSVRPPHPVATVEAAAPQDTVRRRAHAIEVGEWYHRRLMIHKVLAYATVPVFAVQYAAGNQLYTGNPPSWAKPVHQVGASTIAGIFTVNTVTGLWNLWDSRNVPEHRALRTTHALLMLVADGAFAYTGIKLAEDADNSLDRRRQHRNVALGAMGLTITSGVAMKVFNH